MLLLPADIIALLAHFAPLFSRRTWLNTPNKTRFCSLPGG
jgi:hypothetical protein